MEITEKDMIDFEKDIADSYAQAMIRGPCHFSGGNEKQLIEIFKNIEHRDWVFSTHRSHYHALLKSRDPKWLKEQIFLKRSSHINSSKYKIFTSAIVGGILPIALGVAISIKRKKGKNMVWCFVGDMASEMGIFHECIKYARGEDLPIIFIIEDNGFGCYTPTKDVWTEPTIYSIGNLRKLDGYCYKRTYPHYGLADKNGKKIWINF
jgi:pyruvate dehydrogenase E1 component alpha subunit